LQLAKDLERRVSFWEKEVGMKKAALSLLVLVLWASLAFAASEESELRTITEGFLKKLLGKRTFKVERFRTTFDDDTGFYVVALILKEKKRKPRPVLLYISKDKKHLFLGTVFDAKSGEDLSREHFRRLMPEVAKVPKKVDLKKVSFRPPALGEGEKVLLISNPSCPHCRKLVPVLIDHVRKKNPFYALYYKTVPFGKKRKRLEELIECVRQRRTDIFWDFVKRCYTSSEKEAIKWLKGRAGEDFVEGCKGNEITRALEADSREADEIGVQGIPAAVIRGKLYEGVGNIRKQLMRK